jgi:hypothetical protein
MSNANMKPMFIINDEALSDLDERSTHTEHGRDKHGSWFHFRVNGVPLTVSEWGIGSGRYTVYEQDEHAYHMIEANADTILRHIDRGFPRVSGSFPPVVINTGAVPTATANDDKSADLINGDDDIDALLAEFD